MHSTSIDKWAIRFGGLETSKKSKERFHAMRLVTATPNALYCDTDEVLTASQCSLLKSFNIRGVVRYLSSLTLAERDAILDMGLELYFVNYSREPGWIPSASEGAADAQRDLACLSALAIPTGVHVAFDLEGPGGTAADVIAHVNAHAGAIKKSFYLPELYVGEGTMLTSAELYDLASELYWQSCSELRDGSSGLVPLCDYAMIQGRPFDVTLVGYGTKVTIDYNFTRQDTQGRLPIGVAA